MMKKHLIAAAFAALISTGPVNAQSADGFLRAAADVPQMPALEEVASTAVVFDTPGGRIIDVVLEGDSTEPEVIAFYRQSLTALGWAEVPAPEMAIGPHATEPSVAFENEWERLSLAFEDLHRGLMNVRVSITPLSGDLPVAVQPAN